MCLQRSLVVLKVKKVDPEQGKTFSSLYGLPNTFNASQVCNSHPRWNSTPSRSGHQGPHGLDYVELAGRCVLHQSELYKVATFQVDHQLMCLSRLDVTGERCV